MKELNYFPNSIARSLAKGKNPIIAIVVPHIAHPYFFELIEHLESEAYKNNYSVIVFNSKDDSSIEKKCLDRCQSLRVSALILCSSSFKMYDKIKIDIPTFTIERKIQGYPSIEVDNYNAGCVAAKILASKGCKNLAYIGGNLDNKMPADQRQVGFVKTCTDLKLNVFEYNCSNLEYDKLNYLETINKMFNEHKKIDGIFTSGDLIAAQVIDECYKRKIKVPKDIKIIGFDDDFLCELLKPKLSSFHQPLDLIAQKAIDNVIKLSEGKSVDDQLILPVNFIERDSTK